MADPEVTTPKKRGRAPVILVIVIGVLVALAVAFAAFDVWSKRTVTELTQAERTRGQILHIHEGLEGYAKVHGGAFPDRLQDAVKYMPDEVVPVDAWGNGFVYTLTSPATYKVVSYGADGKEGGEGTEADIEDYQRP